MHDGMQYDPIQSQGEGHEPLKSEIRPFSKAICPIYNGAGKWQGRIFDFCPSFLCHVTLKLAVSRSRPPVPYGANFRNYNCPILRLLANFGLFAILDASV